jgi:hypothetical protein
MPVDEGQERRAEPRHPAHGPVVLRPRGEPQAAVTGKLIDIARSGFRAQHALRTLCPGQEVDFEIAGLPGLARVVWTRITGVHVESGFLILSEGEG